MLARYLLGWARVVLVCAAIVGSAERTVAAQDASVEGSPASANHAGAPKENAREGEFEAYLKEELKSTRDELNAVKQENAKLAPYRMYMSLALVIALLVVAGVWLARSIYVWARPQQDFVPKKDEEKLKLQLALAAIEATTKIECARAARATKELDHQEARVTQTLQALLGARPAEQSKALSQSIADLRGSVDTFVQTLLARLESVIAAAAKSSTHTKPQKQNGNGGR